ncbi:MAG: PQQ-binding-like beta-propeller repeat protein [Bacteroidetes bacterium]|nr:PQQ-binding-like beta-propeller repeat protein [Bacteroidota bacterium]MCY4205935.1 PQQ-binding-like beta-propeller repeat protein [Bacteroidota bacterium]
MLLLSCTSCSGLALKITSAPEILTEPEPPLEIAWTYNARAGFGPDAPLIYEDVVMVATRQGEVHVIDLNTGKRIGDRRFGNAVNGSPIVIDNTVIVPLAQGRRALAAYDLDRAVMRWRTEGAPIQVGIGPVDSGGIIVNTAGEVQRFDVTTGANVWKYQIPERSRVYARPLIHLEFVIVGVDNGTILALSLEDGALIWSTHIGDPVYVTPAVHEKELFISTTRGRLIAMDLQTGTISWDAVLDDETIRISTPAVDDEFVVIGGSDGVLRVFDQHTRQVKWDTQCPDALVAPPLMTTDVIYTGSMGNSLYAFDRYTGELLQTIELPGRVKSGIGVTENGLIILTEPRHVVRLVTSNHNDETR